MTTTSADDDDDDGSKATFWIWLLFVSLDPKVNLVSCTQNRTPHLVLPNLATPEKICQSPLLLLVELFLTKIGLQLSTAS